MTPQITLRPFIYPDLTKPKGYLSRDMRSQACWYFYTLAQNLYEKVGKTVEDQFAVLEGNLWMDKRYVPVAKAVAILYSLPSPDEFAKAWQEVVEQAISMSLPEPKAEYMRLAPGLKVGYN